MSDNMQELREKIAIQLLKYELSDEKVWDGVDKILSLLSDVYGKRPLYDELIMAVERKFPGESRHDTALRYIREAESRSKRGSETVELAGEKEKK